MVYCHLTWVTLHKLQYPQPSLPLIQVYDAPLSIHSPNQFMNTPTTRLSSWENSASLLKYWLIQQLRLCHWSCIMKQLNCASISCIHSGVNLHCRPAWWRALLCIKTCIAALLFQLMGRVVICCPIDIVWSVNPAQTTVRGRYIDRHAYGIQTQDLAAFPADATRQSHKSACIGLALDGYCYSL